MSRGSIGPRRISGMTTRAELGQHGGQKHGDQAVDEAGARDPGAVAEQPAEALAMEPRMAIQTPSQMPAKVVSAAKRPPEGRGNGGSIALVEGQRRGRTARSA